MARIASPKSEGFGRKTKFFAVPICASKPLKTACRKLGPDQESRAPSSSARLISRRLIPPNFRLKAKITQKSLTIYRAKKIALNVRFFPGPRLKIWGLGHVNFWPFLTLFSRP